MKLVGNDKCGQDGIGEDNEICESDQNGETGINFVLMELVKLMKITLLSCVIVNKQLLDHPVG